MTLYNVRVERKMVQFDRHTILVEAITEAEAVATALILSKDLIEEQWEYYDSHCASIKHVDTEEVPS